MKKKNNVELCAPGQPYIHKSEETCTGCIMFRENNQKLETCPKNKAYDLLQTSMVGGPSIVFCRYVNVGKTKKGPRFTFEKQKLANLWQFMMQALYISTAQNKKYRVEKIKRVTNRESNKHRVSNIQRVPRSKKQITDKPIER